MADKALAVLFRLPIKGRVKSRLSPPLMEDDVVRLYRLFLEDLFSTLEGLKGVDIYGFYTTDGTPVMLPSRLRNMATLMPQCGGDLGSRLYRVFYMLHGFGYRRVVAIGSDSPDLPVDYIEEGFSRLRASELVLGPAADGGYYLIGMKYPWKGLFRAIPWGTTGVFDATMRRAESLSIDVATLCGWYDVDTIEGLHSLLAHGDAKYSVTFAKELLYGSR